MRWNRWYTVRSYVLSTLWLAPVIAFLSAILLSRIMIGFKIARRLRSMVLNPLESFPEQRHPTLIQEPGILDRTLEGRNADLPEDLALARFSDFQSLGGAAALNSHPTADRAGRGDLAGWFRRDAHDGGASAEPY